MACKFGNGKDSNGNEFTFIQCSLPDPAFGGYHVPEGETKKRLEPYEDNECAHLNRFENHGRLTCQNCGMVYNERSLTWEIDKEREF
jgi:hypothetical protein